MNRRVVLIDQNETQDYTRYYGAGLGGEVYTLQYLGSLYEQDRNEILNFREGDAVLLVKGEPFKYLRGKYHFGVRSENYSDCSKLRRLSIEGGVYVKCVEKFPKPQEIADFMSPEFTVPREYSWYRHKIIHTYDEAMTFLWWIKSLPADEDLGFDYEASGMPLDREFFLSGASICNIQYGGFISFTDIRRTSSPEEYQNLLKVLGETLVERMNHLWVYNMQYEFQVSHRELGVDLYNLCDASVINVLDGDHLKKYSLKWTAQKVLDGVRTWDVDFDKLSDLMDSMFYETVGKLKKDKKKVFKVTLQDYQNTPEWTKICELYPDHIGEFERLIQEYWGFPFMCVPSDILGFYCNLDSFYTLMIYKEREHMYSPEVFQTFLDNARLGARLHASGLYIDEPYRLRYQEECHKMMAWGITYCATARCKIKMRKHEKLMASLKRYNDTAQKLLEQGIFCNGDPKEIVKNIFLRNLDTLDVYETGLNEGKLLLDYGDVFAGQFIEIVKAVMKDIKFKGKIDEKIGNKRKLISMVADLLVPILGLDKLKLGNKHLELEKYLYYEKAYNELTRISQGQLSDIENIPQRIQGFGQDFDLLEYSKFVSDNYFKCKSPIENDEIVGEMFELYKVETAFVAALSESVQQLPGEKKEDFFKNLGILTIEQAFDHFYEEWRKYCYLDDNQKSQYPGPYPVKMFNIALVAWNGGLDYSSAKDVYPVKDVWADFSGFNTQVQFFKEYAGQFEKYGKPFKEEDLDGDFFFMRKFTINYLLYKKYAKVLSTYIDGMFKANNKWVIEGQDHIPLREADPTEPGAIEKCFVHYEVNTKSSKRWSSGFHTIISHSDLKDCIMTPYHYDQEGNRVIEPFLETYFDISSAEVKAAGFASMDPDLISKFRDGTDIYIYSAKLYLGDEFDRLSKTDKKMWRKRFKTIFLGVLYGLGKKSLAERLNCSEQEAENIIQGLYKSFPKLREYVGQQQVYPLQHGGYINTMLGDKLKVQEYTWLEEATTEREKKNLVARIQRLGVEIICAEKKRIAGK